jgi:hypothetical protein
LALSSHFAYRDHRSFRVVAKGSTHKDNKGYCLDLNFKLKAGARGHV